MIRNTSRSHCPTARCCGHWLAGVHRQHVSSFTVASAQHVCMMRAAEPCAGGAVERELGIGGPL